MSPSGRDKKMNIKYWSRLLITTLFLSVLFVVQFSFTNCSDYQASQIGLDKVDIDHPISLGPPVIYNPQTAIDQELVDLINRYKLTSLSDPKPESSALVLLGEALFNDTGMSGLNDVSCTTCHQNELGTGDGLPFPIGSGGIGDFPHRRQVNGKSKPMRRHSPVIFNKGREGMNLALWDGRLQFILGFPSSPVLEISGPNPDRADIADTFENAFDIQPLFPLITPEEFFGLNNDLSSLPNTPAIWDEILKRDLLAHEHYRLFFSNAYPDIELEDINPGHISRAVRAFLKLQFKANATPFDKYLDGDLNALTTSQKQGMKVFYTKGKCNVCHSGPRMTNDGFFSVAVPQLGFEPFQDDLGREEFSKRAEDRYKFKTPGLRNIKLSAPYMHNGAFDNLEAVIDHKNNVSESLENYVIPSQYQEHYEEVLTVDRDPARNQERIQQIDVPSMREGLGLTDQEKSDLLDFLREGLLDTSFKDR